MNEAVIAIVCDFDETLGIDTITYLLTENNVSQEEYWKEVAALVKKSWDPPLAYMYLLMEYAKQGKIDISEAALRKLGKKLPLFPGLPTALSQLHAYVKTEPFLKETKVKLEFFIISGGLEDMIRGSSLAQEADAIFGSSFAYDPKTKEATAIKSAISFTEKTRFLFGINKGLREQQLRENPYQINKVMPQKDRKIPFSQMIYIGDGPSDVPSLSALLQYGGTGIGVVSPHDTFKRGYELAKGKRITVGPYTANYKKGSDMRKVLEETILRMGLEIAEQKRKHAPK